ncbi:MAG: hypothetical protein AB1442_05905 [Nitrospirota bacterium]
MKKYLFFVLFLLMTASPAPGETLYEEQLNRGIRNSDPYAYLLIENAKKEESGSGILLKEAVRYAPDLPAAYFELAKAVFSFEPEKVFESVDYMRQSITSYKHNFWWAFTMLSSLFASLLLSFFVSVVIVVTVRLLKDVPMISHEIQENRNKVLILFVLILSFFGPLYLLGSLLILTGLYMTRWDRVVVYVYLIILLASPLIFFAVSAVLTAPASSDLKAVVRVNEGRGNTYALSVLGGGKNSVELFSYALALKREGRFQEAIDAYYKLLSFSQNRSRVYTNLANCYVGLYEMEKAKDLYKKSLETRPLVSTLYNLSQVYRETLDFKKGEEYFLAAQGLDRVAVSRFRSIFGRNPNRFVIDERLPESELWEYAAAKTSRATAMGLSLLPPLAMSASAVLMGIVFFGMSRLRNRAYRCRRCGTIMCNRCEKHIHWGHMCPQCFKSLVKLDELDARERISRILLVYEHKKKKREIIKILSLILPGSGQIYAGNILQGLLFLWPFLFFLFIPVMNSFFNVGMSHFSHLWLSILSLILTAGVYAFANIVTRRRIARGWL